MIKYQKENDGYKYLLVCIDVFSKYAWVIPLVNKTGPTIVNALDKIFKERKPIHLHTDKGKEFLNKDVKKMLKTNGVSLYVLHSDMKASIVERLNRTLKERMWRYFTKNNNHKYINIVQDLVRSYNKSYHRSIKTTPISVKKANQNTVFFNLYGFAKDRIDFTYNKFVKVRFKSGDLVRISKYKTLFQKGYEPNWRKEIFVINRVLLRYPPVYEIKDLNDEIIEGSFYDNELQKVYKKDT